jgi:tetratricopeptide (TPR) repeat protein
MIGSLIASAWLLASSRGIAGEVHQYPECHKSPSESDIQGAKGAFQAGSVSFNEADYDRAVLYWEDAFRRDCTATLLLHHLARAYEGQGNYQQSVVALKTYLERSPELAERPQILRRIEVFEQKIEEERQRAAREEEERRAKAAPVVAVRQPQPNAKRGNPNLYVNPLIPIGVGAVGASAAIVGVILYAVGSNDVSKYDASCTKHGACTEEDNQGKTSAESRRDWGEGIAATGVILTVGGAGWYLANEFLFKEPPKPPGTTAPKKTAVEPWIAPRVAGLTWRGTF